MGLVDFTNLDAVAWFQGHLRRLIDQGVDCFEAEAEAEVTSQGSGTWAARVLGGAATTSTDGKAGLSL